MSIRSPRIFRKSQPIPKDNPHGEPVEYQYHGCLGRTAAYPSEVPAGWEHDGKWWWCPACSKGHK